jgi:cytochrome c-type biogenesis protein CcmF
VLTSVHAFAADPTRGLFILVFLGSSSAVRCCSTRLRSPDGDDGAPFATSSRETLLLANNLLLTSACAMVIARDVVSAARRCAGSRQDLGRPAVFALLFVLLMAPLVLLLSVRTPDTLAARAGLATGRHAGAVGRAGGGNRGRRVLPGAAGARGRSPRRGRSAWVLLGTMRFLWSRLRTPGSRFPR